MTAEESPIRACVALNADERAAVANLAALCNAADGLDLKLSLDDAPSDAPPGPTCFLCYAGGTLVGFCGLDGGMEVELCGMVHPAYRRRGIGRGLLAAARAACARRGVVELLLICEVASPAGQAFAAGAGGRFVFAEHHMERDIHPDPPAPAPAAPGTQGRNGPPALDLSLAGSDDVDTLARIIAAAFGDPPDVVRERVAGDLAHGADRYYLARQGPAPVGALKIVPLGDRAGIYAFGVLPDLRGRGLGRQILQQMLAQLAAAGWTRAALEVDIENAPALGLYHTCGFQITTTYQYYALPL